MHYTCFSYSVRFTHFVYPPLDNLAGGYDIHPAWTSDDNHLLMIYYAGGLLQDKEKRYSTGLLPERKKELDELLKNIKEDDNPVVILVTLKPKKDNKQ